MPSPARPVEEKYGHSRETLVICPDACDYGTRTFAEGTFGAPRADRLLERWLLPARPRRPRRRIHRSLELPDGNLQRAVVGIGIANKYRIVGVNAH